MAGPDIDFTRPPTSAPVIDFSQLPTGPTPNGASVGFWSQVRDALKPRKYSEISGFVAKKPGETEGMPGVSEGAGLAGGLAEWDKASGGEIAGGVGDILQGDVAKGLHRMFVGTGHAMTPMLPILAPGMIAAPLTTGVTIGGAAAGGAAAQKGAEALGATPEQAQVAGDVGQLVGGFGANRVASFTRTAVAKARNLWDLIPEETQKSIAKKAISMVPGAKTVSTGLDIKKDFDSVLDAIRAAGEKAAPPAPTEAAASQPAGAKPSGEMSPQGWYYLGRLQEIARGIEAEEAPAAAKNITAARAAKLTKPVVPPKSTEDLEPVLQEMLKRVTAAKERVTAAKGKLSDLQ